jgi:hypothetical protein
MANANYAKGMFCVIAGPSWSTLSCGSRPVPRAQRRPTSRKRVPTFNIESFIKGLRFCPGTTVPDEAPSPLCVAKLRLVLAAIAAVVPTLAEESAAASSNPHRLPAGAVAGDVLIRSSSIRSYGLTVDTTSPSAQWICRVGFEGRLAGGRTARLGRLRLHKHGGGLVTNDMLSGIPGRGPRGRERERPPMVEPPAN